MLKQARIAFIGGGAMGEAMINGLVAGNLVQGKQIFASDPIRAKREQIERQYGVQVTDDNAHAVVDADVVILAVKPQIFPKAAQDLVQKIAPESLVLSIMAGVPIGVIGKTVEHERIVRCMPNTPAQVGKGITVWMATQAVTPEQREQTRVILGALGEEIAVDDERYLDMATGLSGSGPGFVLLLIESMIDAGVQIGFSRADAEKMVLQTVDGTVEWMRQSGGTHPAELRNLVTSPGGTTAAGLFELEAGGVRSALIRAVDAAYHRSQELGAAYR
jgi:pyrroline-5-carboxylate reductase